MIVQYQLTLKDWEVFGLAYYRHSSTLRTRLLNQQIAVAFITGVFSILVFLLLIFVSENGLSSLALIFALMLGLITAVIAFAVTPGAIERTYMSTYRKLLSESHGKNQSGNCTLNISPEAIVLTTDYGEGKTLWSAVSKVEVVDEYAYIHLSVSNAIIVPKRAFRDEALFEEFVKLARLYHQTSNKSL